MNLDDLLKKRYKNKVGKFLSPKEIEVSEKILSILENINNLNEKDIELITSMSSKGYNEMLTP